MSEFTVPFEGGCFKRSVNTTTYSKIYKLTECKPEDLVRGDIIVFEDSVGSLVAFNGVPIQVVMSVIVDEHDSRVNTIPYQINAAYSATGYAPFSGTDPCSEFKKKDGCGCL